MRTLKAASLIGALAIAAPAYAQTHTQHDAALGASPAIVQALIDDVEQVEQKLIGLAEAIPETSWAWRPGEGVRSVGQVMLHVAADNYFIPAFTGADAPASTGITGTSYPSVQAFEGRQLDKAATIAELRASFAHLKGVMRAVDDAALGANLDVFGMQMTGLRLWVMATTHLHEHLGQSIAYARSNGVVPPWSRQNAN